MSKTNKLKKKEAQDTSEVSKPRASAHDNQPGQRGWRHEQQPPG